MFSYNRVVKDVVNEPVSRREITVEFINELSHTKEKMLSFSIKETDLAIKKAFNSYLDELNFVPPAISDITVTSVVDTPPTQAELDKRAWEINWVKLQTVDKLIASGVLTGDEAQIVALRNKVKDDFKPAYLG